VTLITSRGAVDAQTAAAEIASGHTQYVAGPDSYVRARIRAIASITGMYLYANWDGSHRNNLHQLSAPRTAARPIARTAVRRRLRESFVAAARSLLRAESPARPIGPGLP
jgi:hypothetical protein